MSDPGFALLAGVETLLRADAPLAALFANGKPRLYDLPPTDAPMPFVQLGDGQTVDQGAMGFDGSEAELVLHVWSRPDPPGMAEAKQIAAAVVDAMTGGDLVLDGFRTVQVLWKSTRLLLEPDGQTVHAAVTFAISADPA